MPPRVILAGGDPGSRYVLEAVLRQRLTCRLTVLQQGFEVLEALAKHPDTALVIAHATLPDMSGLELLNQLRRQYPAIKVVICAGVRDEALAERALRQGAVDYLLVSDPPQRLATVIASLLASPEQARVPETTDPFAGIVGTGSQQPGTYT